SIDSGTGTCSVTATKAADDNYAQATSDAFPVDVSKADQTVTFDDAPASAHYNETFQVSPTSDSGLDVSVAATVGSGCTVDDTLFPIYDVTMTSGSTDCHLAATQAGNDHDNAASGTAVTSTATTPSPDA